jgi:hypothetical protein
MQTVYMTLREEIVAANNLMHWLTVITLVVLLAGLAFCEHRRTGLSVALPLISVGWAASVVRLDFFIQRIGAYLLPIERRLLDNTDIPPWETWKNGLPATKIIVPVADMVLFSTIFVATALILFGPTRSYFKDREWRGFNSYSISILILIVALLSSIALIPSITRHYIS